MLQSHHLLRRIVPLLLVVTVGACDSQSNEMEGELGDDGMELGDDGMELICDDEDRADAFSVDLTKQGERHTVTIAAATPAQPVRGDNRWTVLVSDAAGSPIEGMTIDAKPWMPDHGHGSPVEEGVTEGGGGEYTMDPLNLFMAGFWAVSIELVDAEGEVDEVMFGVCVE
jgi:hypothetical protein